MWSPVSEGKYVLFVSNIFFPKLPLNTLKSDSIYMHNSEYYKSPIYRRRKQYFGQKIKMLLYIILVSVLGVPCVQICIHKIAIFFCTMLKLDIYNSICKRILLFSWLISLGIKFFSEPPINNSLKFQLDLSHQCMKYLMVWLSKKEDRVNGIKDKRQQAQMEI